MISSPTKKKGKAKETAKIQTFNDKYARTGTFTSMSSGGSSGASKTKTSSINLGYDQPSKKLKLVEQDRPEESMPGSQSKESGNIKSRSQAASVLIKPFQDAFPRLLDHLLATEVDDQIGSTCDCGEASRIIKCLDCFMSPSTCQACFASAHIHNPTHWAERWNGHFFVRHDISQLDGYVISLGHSGARCPKHPVDNNSKAVKFTLCDRTGIHETKVLFCDCIGGGHPTDQLMSAAIFPGSMGSPITGFTFNLLKDFHLQALTSKKTAYNFVAALRRRSNNADPTKVPFLRVIRVFKVLTMLKRSGQAHGIDAHFPLRPPGSIIVPCFACPEVGLNMSFDDQEIDEEFRWTFWPSTDDVSLTEGRGIFPAKDSYQAYLKHAGISPEKSTCAKLNAVDMQNKLKFRGCTITGVVSVNCARHNFFWHGSTVDLQLGEKYSNTDYALAQSLYLANQLWWILLTYDINCQYGINLVERFRKSFPGLVGTAEKLVLLVGKMHLRGHKEDCQYRFSLNYTDCCGHTAGEAIEGSWAEAKQAGTSTKEMNPGHRHDTLTDYQNDWNHGKVQGLTDYLYRQYTNAKATLPGKIMHFHGLSRRHGQELATKWLKMPTTPIFKRKEWHSVYRYLPGRATVFRNMLADEASRASAISDQQTTPVAIFLNEGLKLKSTQWKAAHILKHHRKHKDPADLTQLQTLRVSLTVAIKKWRKQQQVIMPSVVDLVVKQQVETPEEETLFLPSDFQEGASDHQKYQLETLAPQELKLWEGSAHDHLESVRQAVKYVVSLAGDKRRHACGRPMNTRATEILNQGNEKKRAAVESYRKAREIIVQLGRSMADGMFPALLDEDLSMKDVTSSHKLGDGLKVDSWIWRHGPLGEMPQRECDEFQEQSDSVQWFRARADMYRWIEQKETLEYEFRRVITLDQ
ncbi:hypothetical protein HWV62_26913 [Athelia sp. TMB]|nr:hypothetical protein HWV62_26913 [Athelia sp. TMB]